MHYYKALAAALISSQLKSWRQIGSFEFEKVHGDCECQGRRNETDVYESAVHTRPLSVLHDVSDCLILTG